MSNSFFSIALISILFTSCGCNDTNSTPVPIVTPTDILYTMPEESEPHEGTWLQWPHEYQYGVTFRNRLDATWVTMTKVLVTSEKAHIIVYDEIEKNRVIGLLNTEGVPLTNIDFKIYPTDFCPRAQITRCAPSAASSSATARPRPLLLAATSATFPRRPKSI